jgi:RNA-binding protein NOB1
MAGEPSKKSIHTVILDAGPIIKGEPSVSILLQQCQRMLSIPSVISEIRDQETRKRLETTILPFLELRSPKPESIAFISEFARKTGDSAVLSRTDIQLLALAYDVECELNHGDWRLRRSPGQKRTNGPTPASLKDAKSLEESDETQEGRESTPETKIDDSTSEQIAGAEVDVNAVPSQAEDAVTSNSPDIDQLSTKLDTTGISHEEVSYNEDVAEDSDSDGWITPSNIKRKQMEDANADSSGAAETKIMQVVGSNTQDLC